MCLLQNATKRSDSEFRMKWYHTADFAAVSNALEHNVAAALPHSDKAELFKNTYRLSPGQPRKLRHT